MSRAAPALPSSGSGSGPSPPDAVETKLIWPRWNLERELRSLLARVESARQVDVDLLSRILAGACPRLGASLAPKTEVDRLTQAEAWVELGLWLIGWELPDWGVHRLTRDDARWSCSM
jgi:hypothetical protein